MKKLILIGLGLFFTSTGNAQSYRTAAGFRIGEDFTLSISQRIVPKSTLDLYQSTGLFSNHASTGLAYKKHFPLITKRLNLFAGVGPVASWANHNQTGQDNSEHGTRFGFLLTGGIDFTIGRLNLGYDIMPTFLPGSGEKSGKILSSSALTVRYVFVKQPKQVKKWFRKKK